MGEELLSLSTIVEHDTITIASKKHPRGKTYEVANQADFGPLQYARLMGLYQEIEKLAAVKRLTAKQKTRVEEIRDELVKLILRGIDKPVLAELTGEQKELIYVTWISGLAAGGAAEGNPASRRTTSASSRGYRPSTAATRKRGSAPRRG